MLRESATAVIARGEVWEGRCATEPFEAGWATEAVIFIRALSPPEGPMPDAHVEISPDGIRWAPEGSTMALPGSEDALAVARVGRFGNWLRVRADLPEGSRTTVLITIHVK